MAVEPIEVIAARERLAYPFPRAEPVVTINPDGTVTEEVVASTQEAYDRWILERARLQRDQQRADESTKARKDRLQAQEDTLTPILAKLQAVPAQNLTPGENKILLTEIVAWALPKMIAEKEASL